MKYIVGASIGGLFGIGMPLMMEMQEINNDEESPRLEEFQPAEKDIHTPINNMLLLPDNNCGLLEYESLVPIEQAKECLTRSEADIPAI
tara:strand:- start:1246 stop:1512 length:267 start_codon:yes stop_codon:yes gene_type:complete